MKSIGTLLSFARLIICIIHSLILELQSLIQRSKFLGKAFSKSTGEEIEWLPVIVKFIHDKFELRGLRTITSILLTSKIYASGTHQGVWDLMIQTESSTVSSASWPAICKITLIINELSAPVLIPVRSSQYLRKKVLPLRGNEHSATLLLEFASPSRRRRWDLLNIHLQRSHIVAFLDLNKARRLLRLIVVVSGLG